MQQKVVKILIANSIIKKFYRWWHTPVISALKKLRQTRHQWLTPIILATQEAEMRRIKAQAISGK
jgi:hypothetical protein